MNPLLRVLMLSSMDILLLNLLLFPFGLVCWLPSIPIIGYPIPLINHYDGDINMMAVVEALCPLSVVIILIVIIFPEVYYVILMLTYMPPVIIPLLPVIDFYLGFLSYLVRHIIGKINVRVVCVG